MNAQANQRQFFKSCIKVCNFSLYLVIGERVICMKKPKIINLFIDYAEEFSLLSDAQAGRLIKALLAYADKGEKPDFSDDKAICVMFSMMKKQVDRDFGKYQELCDRRSEAGKKGGAPKGNQNARKSSNSSKTSKDNDKDKNENKNKDDNKDEDKDNDLCDAHGAGEGRASSTRYILETSEIIDYLNQKAGSRYQPTAKSTERLIAALLNDGYTVEDMKRVVDMKCKEWKFTEYQKYLRPETLFGEKFEGYLNTPQAPTLPKRQSNSAWYDPSYAATIERYKNTSLFDD